MAAGIRDEMSCRELVELVTDYLEGSLSSADLVRFEEHLAECPGCRVYLDQMRQTIRALGRIAEDAVLPEAMDELLRAFRSWKSTS